MSFFSNFVAPVLDRLDSEMMHDRAVDALHLLEGSAPGRALIRTVGQDTLRVHDPKLQVTLAGINFTNPLCVAAGWDKQARAVRALGELGFAAVEVGTVVEQPQPGNPRPRQGIIAPGVAINCYGFNSVGMEQFGRNLRRYEDVSVRLGINIGKNKSIANEHAAETHGTLARRFCRRASYLTINVSSPNTPGLRELQDRSVLTDIVQAVVSAVAQEGVSTPVFVKIAPELELSAVDDAISVALDNKLAGIIATNTTNNADIKGKYGTRWREQMGGLSGNDAQYRALSTSKLAHIYRQTNGRLELIGSGGVFDGATALEKIFAGAKLVQVLTAIREVGPHVANRINSEILSWMEREGVRSLAEVVGSETRGDQTTASLARGINT
ncbi:MAG: quinone-dependent dihydroorotate dehydrogenase [Deltaproteobacteria bacterium]|nr:quinone-dependent dihydroorotate dehydrogenase [Deltaproteobacteria bacterium]